MNCMLSCTQSCPQQSHNTLVRPYKSTHGKLFPFIITKPVFLFFFSRDLLLMFLCWKNAGKEKSAQNEFRPLSLLQWNPRAETKKVHSLYKIALRKKSCTNYTKVMKWLDNTRWQHAKSKSFYPFNNTVNQKFSKPSSKSRKIEER